MALTKSCKKGNRLNSWEHFYRQIDSKDCWSKNKISLNSTHCSE